MTANSRDMNGSKVLIDIVFQLNGMNHCGIAISILPLKIKLPTQARHRDMEVVGKGFANVSLELEEHNAASLKLWILYSGNRNPSMTDALYTDLETFPRAAKYRCLFGLAPDLLKSHHTNLNVNIIQKLL